MTNDKFGFAKKIQELKAMRYDLPKDIAAAGQLYFQRNFDKQQWDGVKWEPRIYAQKKDVQKPLLVDTGKLRQSLQNSVREADDKKITWGTDVPYAKYLNYGTDKMVAREFIGGSKEFHDKMKQKIKTAYDKVMHAK